MLKKIQLYSVPLISLIVFMGFFIFYAPEKNLTGMAVADISADSERELTAKVNLKLSDKEIIHEDSLVVVYLDDKKASMPIKRFIEISKKPYSYEEGTLGIADYTGYGYIGNYEYSIDLSNFDIDRKIFAGNHKFKTMIVYRDFVLYEDEFKLDVEEI